MTDHVRSERHGSTLQIILQRPEKKNALTLAMYERMVALLQEGEADSGVRALVLSGSEDCFTSGNDVLDFMQSPPDESSPVSRFLAQLPQMEKPLVAAVAGPVIGVGVTLLLHCDLVYAASNARFKMPFVQLGVVPEAGSSLLLPRLLGRQKASELLMLGESFDAEAACSLGIVNQVVAPGEVIGSALAVAARFEKLAPTAIKLTKQLIKRGSQAELADTMAEEGRIFMERIRSPEAMEAIQAFLQKRDPDFSQF